MQKLLIKALKEKRNILLVRKFQNKLKDSQFKLVKETIKSFKLEDYFDFNLTDLRCTCKINGSELRCIGLDEPERVKGYVNISDVFVDELSEMTQEDWELLDGSVRSKIYTLPLQLYGAFNPVSKSSWVYKYFQFDSGIIPDNTFILKTTWRDNPFLDQSYIERMNSLKQRNYTRWKIESEGEFCSLDKLIYTNWDEGICPEEEKKKLKLICGLDFGYVNDPTAFVASYVDEENKIIYIDQEFYETGLLNNQIAERIKVLGFAKEQIIADSAEQKSIEELKVNGISRVKPSVKGKGSILQGISFIQQYRLVVNTRCSGIITELQNYSWQKDRKTNEYINEPIDAFNHGLDALRYSMQIIGKGHLKTMNKSILGL